MKKATDRLSRTPKELEERAKTKAQAEYEYRKALSESILKYKGEGYPATLISDLARGEVAHLKLQRDLADGLYTSARESMKALQAELSGLQTITRYQDEG